MKQSILVLISWQNFFSYTRVLVDREIGPFGPRTTAKADLRNQDGRGRRCLPDLREVQAESEDNMKPGSEDIHHDGPWRVDGQGQGAFPAATVIACRGHKI